MELNCFHTVSQKPSNVEHMLSITKPDAEISYAYKKKTCILTV